MKQMSLTTVVIGASTFACAALLSFGWSEQGGVSLSVESAQARVGRPLTPVSVAGVARRQTRRAVYGAGAIGAGAAAVGTAAAVAATTPNYWGGQPNYWGGRPYSAVGPYGGSAAYAAQAYAAQPDPSFGQPHYVTRAYHGHSPYYGYTGWEEYSGRNFITCRPGSMVKLDDGLMHVCQ
jgi:hypothetical protein